MEPRRNLLKKALVCWLAYSIGFGPFAVSAARAASLDLTDVPLPSKKRPNPNMIFSIDDSGSMDDEVSINGSDGAFWYNRQDGRFFGRDLNNIDRSITVGTTADRIVNLADPAIQALGPFNGLNNFNALGCSGSDAGTTCGTPPPGVLNGFVWKKYVMLFPNGSCGSNCATRSYPDSDNDHYAIPPTPQFGWLRSSIYNRQYYNPNINYDPWKPYNDGSGKCPSGAATGSGSTAVCTPADANPKNALSHPVYSTATDVANFDLTQNEPFPGGTPPGTSTDPLTNYYVISGNKTWTVSNSAVQDKTFRMYPGMILPKGSWFTACTGTGYCNSGYKYADQDYCLIYSGTNQPNVTGCVRSGMTFATNLDLKSLKVNGSNPTDYNHFEAQISYNPAVYWRAATGTETADAYGPDGKALKMVTVNSSTTYTLPGAVARSDCSISLAYNANGTVNVAGSTTTCTGTQEMQNYANWFQYWRKRHLSLNGSIGNAVNGVRSLRGGYFLFNNQFNVTMYDFDNTTDNTKNQVALLGAMYQTKGNGGTPTRDSIEWMGQQFQRTDANAPINYKCQFNGGFIITDGFATGDPGNPQGSNSAAGPIGYGNYDGQTPGTVQPTPTAPAGSAYYFNQQNGATVPTGIVNPYKDSAQNTLADIAMKFYQQNLRPDLPAGQVPIKQNDVSPDGDRNPNLHMNTYGLILGLRGLVFGVDAAKTSNPYTNNPGWDTLYGGIDPRALQRDPRAIDELWHATINGRGDMLVADSPDETRNAVLAVVNSIQNKGGAAAAVSVSNANPVKGDNFSYSTSYNSGSWTGDLNAFPIDVDPTSATFGQVSSIPVWNPTPAQRIADADWTRRLFATYRRDTGKGVRFESGQLSGTQLTALTPAKGTFDQVISFLKGDRSNEGTLFRSRGAIKFIDPVTGVPTWGTTDNLPPSGVAVLGDMVDAEPVIVSKPPFSYLDDGYGDFKDAQVGRAATLYQGANDGMLHAFSAADGSELWSYIPSFGFDARQDGTPGLLNLSDKSQFIHHFFVDGTPVAADVDMSKAGTTAGSSPNWRSILVGALGKGGRGWYALDVTSPAATTSDDVAAKVLWEFPNDADPTHAAVKKNIGYSYGKAIVAKTKAAGWVVIVPSGYENGNETGGDGAGYLFVLNPKTGALIKAIPADISKDGLNSSTRAAGPTGLAYISAWADNGDVDNTVQTVYGGDLYGNVWRFDLSGSTWPTVGTLMTTLKDASGARQLVTSEPELALAKGKRVVYIGTGKYFGDKDIPDSTVKFPSATQQQTMYALLDDLSGTTLPDPVRNVLAKRTQTKNTGTGTATVTASDTFDFSNTTTTKGWYVDLDPSPSGERIITNPSIGLGTLTFTSNIPSGVDPCLPGGASWEYQLNFLTGLPVLPGGVGAFRLSSIALASRTVLIRLPDGSVRALVRQSNEQTVSSQVGTPGVLAAGKRKAWRELIVQ